MRRRTRNGVPIGAVPTPILTAQRVLLIQCEILDFIWLGSGPRNFGSRAFVVCNQVVWVCRCAPLGQANELELVVEIPEEEPVSTRRSINPSIFDFCSSRVPKYGTDLPGCGSGSSPSSNRIKPVLPTANGRVATALRTTPASADVAVDRLPGARSCLAPVSDASPSSRVQTSQARRKAAVARRDERRARHGDSGGLRRRSLSG